MPGWGQPPFPSVPDLDQPASPPSDKSVPGIEHWGGGTSTAPTAPWPQVVPPDLPRFPSGAWEFDEPPPAAVQKRARELLSRLWAKGKGAHKTERTAGRWITYQAQVVASGRNGVVAYRLKAENPRIATGPGPAKARPRPVSVPAPRPVSVPAPRPAAPAPGAPESRLQLPTLRYGRGLRPAAPDPDVRIAQGKLGVPSDGRFGVGTKAAVVAFQRTRGLTPDGIVGPKTWVELLGRKG